jgi:DnaJ-class molecular chaperone
MRSKNLIDELEAEDKLMARGYTKANCVKCDARGISAHDKYPYTCPYCQGYGWSWVPPQPK